MRSVRIKALVVAAALLVATPVAIPVAAQDADDSAQVVLDWNQNALAAATSAALPPPVASLVMAMVHGAIYDAVVSIAGKYQPYLGKLEADPTASKVAAAATAAHDVLLNLFPFQAGGLQAKLDTSLEAVPDGAAKDAGVAVGQAAAAQMIAAREGDGRGGTRKLTYEEGPGNYRPTPPNNAEFTAQWMADVKPFLAEDITSLPDRRPIRARQRGVRGRLQRGQGEGRGRGLDPHTRGGRARGVLGHAPRAVVGSRAVARDRAGPRHRGGRPAVRDLGSRDGRHPHRHLEREVPLDVLATRDGHPRGRHGRQRRDRGGPGLGPAHRHPHAALHPTVSGPSVRLERVRGLHHRLDAGVLRHGRDGLQGRQPERPRTPKSFDSFSEGLKDGIELRVLQGIHFRRGDEASLEVGQKAAKAAAERLAAVD